MTTNLYVFEIVEAGRGTYKISATSLDEAKQLLRKKILENPNVLEWKVCSPSEESNDD